MFNPKDAAAARAGKRKTTEEPESSKTGTPDEPVITEPSTAIVIAEKGPHPSADKEQPDPEPTPKRARTTNSTFEETAPILAGHTLAVVPPGIVKSLSDAGIIGHLRPLTERIMDARFYELNLANLRRIITMLLTIVLKKCYHDKGKIIKSAATTEIEKVVPLTVNACMNALYAKLRNIHKQYGRYSSRFNTPASYHKDIELPLPLADAISEIGVFESSCARKCYIYVPVIPEGTKWEGRSEEEWNSYKYESCIQIFKDLNIPCRNVDTRLKSGSAWWTYKTEVQHDMFFGTMIVPPLHYTDNSATIASMFLGVEKDKKIIPLITHLTDDEDYGKKFRLLHPGVQIRAFMALAAFPDEDWNAGTTLE